MARPRLISVVGKKNSGKTTLVVHLARAFTDRGLSVGTIKHGTHAANVDREGTDTWRHFHEGGAERVMIEGPGGRAYVERFRVESDPLALARRFMDGLDLVIAEGFTGHPIPKIEIHRAAVHAVPRFAPDHPLATHWVAMVTDAPKDPGWVFPVIGLGERDWMAAVTTIAWQAAQPLEREGG